MPPELSARLDLDAGAIAGAPVVRRHLSDLDGCFADPSAYLAARAKGDPLLYTVSGVEAGSGPGALHYGLGVLMPGRVGNEYFMTKGHLHSRREAAEVYVGLRGDGVMLLEDEATGVSRIEPLGQGRVVYVPGHTAHRTMNTGSVPLVYIGVYPADAGHDYGAIAERNFRMVVVEREGKAMMVPRRELA
jgi:glucose-6-phosphate isomerase, archaeal